MKKVWMILRRGLLAFLVMILLINLYLIAAQLLFKKDLPKVAGYAQILVISGSMQPAIMAGDLLIIHEQEEYKEQEIVTYRGNGGLITHRIIAIDKAQAVMQGDANNVADDPVPVERIEGKVILQIPMAGNLILFLKTPMGMLLLILALSAIYVFFELTDFIGSRKVSK
ncbi:MAG: signal peptidase I [Eubacteriales bacterium]|nr:signal peptidase I [Eubacteriales bacterium]